MFVQSKSVALICSCCYSQVTEDGLHGIHLFLSILEEKKLKITGLESLGVSQKLYSASKMILCLHSQK